MQEIKEFPPSKNRVSLSVMKLCPHDNPLKKEHSRTRIFDHIDRKKEKKT